MAITRSTPITGLAADNFAEHEVVIANGESVSSAIRTGGMHPVRVICPAAWTTAKLRWQTSRTGQSDAFTAGVLIEAGTKLELGAAADADLTCQREYPVCREYIRLFSCDANGVAVTQGAARTIIVVLAR